MYASPSCQTVFHVDSDEIIGKPFLLFVRADDLASIVEQVDVAKSSTVVTHMRFWFQSRAAEQEIPCEVMLFGAADGIIAILRRCKPFTRRQLITETPVMECFSNASSVCSSVNSSYSSYNKNHGYNRRLGASRGGFNASSCRTGSLTTNFSGSPSNSFINDPCDSYSYSYSNHRRSQKSNNINASGRSKASVYSSSPDISSSVDSHASFTHSISTHEKLKFESGIRAYKASLRGVPIGSINSIRNLDSGHNHLRPLTSLRDDEADIVDSNTVLPDFFRLRQHRTENLDLKNLGLEERIKDLQLDSDDDADDFDDFILRRSMDENTEELQMPPIR
ncbi:hypothetical protein BGZ46_003972 [Entomortierella lignicola]|nr:hypothetical protein BGZ46_003972 [Entomortierella lignicola]